MTPGPRTLTIAGTEVARIGLGTNRLTSTPENHAFLNEAVEAGVGMIDTAHLYTGGESERAIGEALSPKPDGVVVATKGGYETGDPDAIRAQIEQSLGRLRTEVIDLYYLHRVQPDASIEASLAPIAEARAAGKIRDVGISAVDVEQIEAARRVLPIAAVQNHYNLEERGSDEVIDYCEREDIAFVPYYPLQAGSSPQTALAWLLRRSPVTLPIPGTLSIEHLRENLGALEVELADDEDGSG